jgi:hypothetical protein
MNRGDNTYVRKSSIELPIPNYKPVKETNITVPGPSRSILTLP